MLTSNLTGRHRVPKRKLRAGYRASSLQRTSCPKRLHYIARHMLRCVFIVECDIARFLCTMPVFGHHFYPVGYLCATFLFLVASIAELAHGEKSRTQKKSLTQSLTQLIWCPGNRSSGIILNRTKVSALTIADMISTVLVQRTDCSLHPQSLIICLNSYWIHLFLFTKLAVGRHIDDTTV